MCSINRWRKSPAVPFHKKPCSSAFHWCIFFRWNCYASCAYRHVHPMVPYPRICCCHRAFLESAQNFHGSSIRFRRCGKRTYDSYFLLPFAMGACSALGGDVLTDAFGIVAMVAMTPLVTIQCLGLFYQRKLRRTKEVTDAEASLMAPEEISLILTVLETANLGNIRKFWGGIR